MELIHFLDRWIYRDFWVPVWPNIAASILLAVHIKKSNEKNGYKPFLGKKEGPDEGD